jgi:hypothetical protein
LQEAVNLESNAGKDNEQAGKAKATRVRSALLLGLGLDADDGHVRITKGPNFQLLGGSQCTHETMQETAIKFNEELHRRGKRLEQVGPNEFLDILHKVT